MKIILIICALVLASCARRQLPLIDTIILLSEPNPGFKLDVPQLYYDSVDLLFQNILYSTGCTETTYKEYKDSTGTYQIKYEYNSCQGYIPSTNSPGDPHHDAVITVFKEGKQIGEPIQGTYVEKGCLEDVPANWVKIALGK